MTDTKTGLLPCPFCGGEARLIPRYSNPNLFHVSCDDCTCILDCYAIKEAAADYWNDRHPDKSS